MTPTLKDRKQLVQEWIRRFVTYQDEITWFGANSVMRAWAESTAGLVEGAYHLYVALVRRFTLLSSSGDYLRQVCAERGTTWLAETSSKVLVVFQPQTANVSAIALGPPDIITVDDASPFVVGAQIRVRNGNGTVTEVVSIAGIVGNDITIVGALVNVYVPGIDDVDILYRVTVPSGTSINTTSGVTFQTLETVTTGDANPVLDGEGTALALADKAWCECSTKGAAGNIEARAVTELVVPVTGVKSVYNPERATGGDDDETDFDLKYRTMHRPTIANQETNAWIESLAKEANTDVLRGRRVSSTTVGVMGVQVLRRNGGTFSATELVGIELYLDQRARSYMTTDADNITLTAVEVEATITLEAGSTLEDVWRAAASAIVIFLDWRKWEFGTDVDEADMLTLVNNTAGVASLETSSFLPSADVVVGADSLPTLVRLSLQDADTGDVINAELAASF